MEKIDIKSLNLSELTEQIIALGEPKFRAKQVFEWLHKKRVFSFEEMTNISTKFQQLLDSRFYINSLNIAKKLVSQIDNTVKYLYELRDGEFEMCIRDSSRVSFGPALRFRGISAEGRPFTFGFIPHA